MVITAREIRDIGLGWTIKHLPAEFLQEMCWPSSRVWPSVIVQQDNTGTKHPAPLVLNGPSQFLQCFSVKLRIYRLISGQEVDEENAPSVPEYRAHRFPRRQSLFEFRFAGRSTVTPMHWLLFGFWGNVFNLWWSALEIRHCQHGTAAEMLMLTPYALLCVLESVVLTPDWRTIFWTATWLFWAEREMTAEFRNCEATILHNAFPHKLHKVVCNAGWPPTAPSSCTCCRHAVKCLHQRSTICLLMTLGPWQSLRWISIGAILCTQKL